MAELLFRGDGAHLRSVIHDWPDALSSDSVPFVVEGYQLTGTANVNAAGLTIDPAASLPANTYPLTYSVAPEPTTALADVHLAAVVSRQGYGGEVIGLFRRLLRRLGLDRRAAPRRAARHRAAAVVISGERLLVIKRHKRGRDYAVLPGGGVEHGETAAQAALRELQEETSLTAEIDRPLWTGMHNDRPASYFLMTAVRGRAELSGPEARANRPDNSFELHWVTAGQFAEYGLFPHDIRGPLAELLAVDPNPATDQADTPRSPTS